MYRGALGCDAGDTEECDESDCDVLKEKAGLEFVREVANRVLGLDGSGFEV